MPLLRRGQVLTSGDGSRRYQVADPLGAGGFGEAFSGWQIDRLGRRRRAVCIKVTPDDTTWHGESYFGQLLAKERRVVGLLDSFPHVSGTGENRWVRFMLIFELEEETLVEFFERGGTPWTETGARRELFALARVLNKLHGMGASHRDITPDNVYVSGRRRLKLGDFGIAKHGLSGGPLHATSFAWEFVPPSLRNMQRSRWYPSDDVYQLALLVITILRGEITRRATLRDIMRLELEPDLEHVLVRATGHRRSRYEDASALLADITGADERVPVPRSLAGRRVAFTGRLPIPRHEAQARLAQAGGVFQDEVNSRTQAVVVGKPSRRYGRPRPDPVLADVDRRIRFGQKIAILGWGDFLRLTRGRGR